MTAIAHTWRRRRPAARRRPWLQPVFLVLALAILVPICAALPLTLMRGRPLPWQLHVAWVSPHFTFALVALGLAAMQLALPKGDRRHRIVGYGWSGLMAAISLTGMMIQLTPGHVSVIHQMSTVSAVINLLLLPVMIVAARTHRPRLHRVTALLLVGSMLNAGLMEFIPFRTVGSLVFGLFQ